MLCVSWVRAQLPFVQKSAIFFHAENVKGNTQARDNRKLNGNENATKQKIFKKSRTMALHVNYKSLYISLPSSAQHDLAQFRCRASAVSN